MTGRSGTSPQQHPVVSECYERSLALLKLNSKASGIIACSPSKKATDRNYASIFGRDAAICSLGMVVSGDRDLRRIARRSLIALGQHQAVNGQIPKFIKPEQGEVDFWYAGCIDATLWWLIAVEFFNRHCPEEGLMERLREEVQQALNWLLCQEHQGLFLLQQNEASDWADIMPRSGFVLYSNALWLRVKALFSLPHARRTRRHFLQIFRPYHQDVPENRRVRLLVHYVKKGSDPADLFLSFVNFSFWGPEVDTFGNILALLSGVLPASETERCVEQFLRMGVSRPFPARAVHRPIRRNSPLWRLYMERHLQNLPYQYHNGGAWPFIGCFWVLLLGRLKNYNLALHELVRCAEANRVNGWGFHEWFHGKTGVPRGMKGQSWNAAMFILATHSLEQRRPLF